MEPLLIKNGTIIDGTGNPGFKGHILIEGERIRAVIKEGEDLPQAGAVMDATGQEDEFNAGMTLILNF